MADIKLPQAEPDSGVTLVQALERRRSLRDYTGHPLTFAQTTRLLWAAQGINSPAGQRTAPSAGALYPLEIYLVATDVSGLKAGIYRYKPHKDTLETVARGDPGRDLAGAALDQNWLTGSSAVFVIAAVYERTTAKYGQRGHRYVHIEVGHAAQNIVLQATALGLGAGIIGAFDDAAVARVLQIPAPERVLYLVPVGTLADRE